MAEIILGSVTRIAEFESWPLPTQRLPRGRWEAGDYVAAEVLLRDEGTHGGFEVRGGREMRPMTGDVLIGALARRFATLEATGSYEAVGDDGMMNLLSPAGCFGKLISRSRFSPDLMCVSYHGHVMARGVKTNMRDFAPRATESGFGLPVLMIVGTSMSAGKTYAGRVAVRLLKELGHRVVAAKLTGAGRRRDVLSLGDAGADHVFDFIDAGLPSTVCPPDEYRSAMLGLLSRIAETDGTVVVVEAGASPLEPYNGGVLADLLNESIAFTLLCASDPYAVKGIQTAWARDFDLVAGPAANTAAGVQLVERLASLPALDMMEEATRPVFRRLLRASFGRGPHS